MRRNGLGKISLLLPLSSLVIWGSVFASVLLSPGFSWTDDLLSDMGVSEVSLMFNLGLIAGGLLSIIFTLFYVSAKRGQSEHMVAGFFLFLVNSSYILAGIFTLNFGAIHYVFAFLSFIASMIVIGFLSVVFIIKDESTWLGIYGVTALLLNLFIWVLINLPGLALPETVVGLIVTSWFTLFGIKLYRDKS